MPRKPLNQEAKELIDNLEKELVEKDEEEVTIPLQTHTPEPEPKFTHDSNESASETEPRKSPEELNQELAHAMRQLDKITKLFNMTANLYITDTPKTPKFNCIEDELEYRINEVQRRIIKTYNAYNKMTELYVSDDMN